MNKIKYNKQSQQFDDSLWLNFSINRESYDDQYETLIDKSFDYVITDIVPSQFIPEDWEIYIIQERNSKAGTETFKFKVIGTMLVEENNRFFKAEFTHFLNILLTERMPIENNKYGEGGWRLARKKKLVK